MRGRVWLAVGVASLWVLAVFAQTGLGPIGQLQGKVDASNALVVAPTAGISGSPTSTNSIANLTGKVDANNALVVTMLGNGSTATPNILCLDGTNQDVCLQRVSSGVGNLTAGSAGTTFSRLNFGTALVSNPALAVTGAGLKAMLADNSTFTTFVGSSLSADSQRITAGSGTGITVGVTGQMTRQVYQVTIATTAFTCAATTCDVTIGTLKAKQWLTMVIADQTVAFTCAAVCTTSTLSFVLGKGAGGAEYLASWDADAGTGQFGDADAELGTLMVRAAAIQGGSLGSWSSTQAVVLRLTSGAGNIGTGAATNLGVGSVTFYLVVDALS